MGTSDDEARIKVRDMLEKIGVVMLVTQRDDGTRHARPMAIQRIENETVWFYTREATPKTEEIGGNPDVLLAASHPSHQCYVAAHGMARQLRDTALQRELWTESARVWFPGGPEDEALGVIEVTLEGAEYWDSPSSFAVHAYGYVKALATGRSPNPGENAKVEF